MWEPLVGSGGGGEANTSSNVGTGQGLAKAKVGVDLPFKSLLGTANEITLVGSTNEVTFSLNAAIARIAVAQSWTALQIFNHGFFKLNPTAGDVGSPTDGMQWYNSTTNKFRGRENGANVDMRSGGADHSAFVEKITADQSISNVTWTGITFNLEHYDTDGFHDNTTNPSRMTIPSGLGGKYLIIFVGTFATNSTGQRRCRFYVNGVAETTTMKYVALTGSSTSVFAIAYVELTATQYIEAFVWQDSGGSINMFTGSQFTIIKLDKGG